MWQNQSKSAICVVKICLKLANSRVFAAIFTEIVSKSEQSNEKSIIVQLKGVHNYYNNYSVTTAEYTEDHFKRANSWHVVKLL